MGRVWCGSFSGKRSLGLPTLLQMVIAEGCRGMADHTKEGVDAGQALHKDVERQSGHVRPEQCVSGVLCNDRGGDESEGTAQLGIGRGF